jgi:uncharacterized DUF497 family protein
MRILRLVADPDREEHVAAHGVAVDETNEIAFGKHVVRRVREGRYRLVGQTFSSRYLTVFVAARGGGDFGLVTARDATSEDRRAFRLERGG